MAERVRAYRVSMKARWCETGRRVVKLGRIILLLLGLVVYKVRYGL